ncbi:hypothetical protein AAULR_07311 [Lacticaseibacillus rhamnosus MTCC 5462]|nr:hypothetical protein AAULR_07311 [Lacticaseibacillus rhamnosus MTCC 5462]
MALYLDMNALSTGSLSVVKTDNGKPAYILTARHGIINGGFDLNTLSGNPLGSIRQKQSAFSLAMTYILPIVMLPVSKCLASGTNSFLSPNLIGSPWVTCSTIIIRSSMASKPFLVPKKSLRQLLSLRFPAIGTFLLPFCWRLSSIASAMLGWPIR